MRAVELINLIALAVLLTTFAIIQARPQQFSFPSWNQNPNNGWNQTPNNDWNQTPNNDWNQIPNNGWNTNNGIGRITITTTTTPRTGATTATTASPSFLACMQTCQSTMEYNPVCGSDNISYHNEGRRRCALMCGKNVATTRQGTCQPL